MKLLTRVQSIYKASEKVISSVRLFRKDPWLWAGIASVSSVLSCNLTYGVEPVECSIGERECIDKYAAICFSVSGNSYDNQWYASECEKGCDSATGKCVDGKVLDETSACETGTVRCHENSAQVCIDNIWYQEQSSRYYEDGKCEIPENK